MTTRQSPAQLLKLVPFVRHTEAADHLIDEGVNRGRVAQSK